MTNWYVMTSLTGMGTGEILIEINLTVVHAVPSSERYYIFFRYLHLFTMQVIVTDWFSQMLQL